MGLVKEPKEVDFSICSSEWKGKDLSDYKKLIVKLKKKHSGKGYGLKTEKKSK